VIAIDANILVYASDKEAGERHAIARAVLARAIATGDLLLPLQVVGEFCNIGLRKLGHAPAWIEEFVLAWTAVAQVESYGLADARAALRARLAHGLSFWDALIWAVCERNGVDLLVSEDFQDGRRLGGVTFLDPFNPGNAARLGLASP